MDRQAKKDSLNFLVDRFSGVNSAVFTSYKGLSAQDMADIRNLIREGGGEYKVVKNTLALMALEKSGSEQAIEFVEGPCGIAFSSEEPIGIVKTLVKFAKEHELLVLKGGILEGEVVDVAKLKVIASLPSRDELLANLLGSLNAPISKLSSYLYQMISGLVCVINLIKDKQAHSDASLPQSGQVTSEQEEGGENAK